MDRARLRLSHPTGRLQGVCVRLVTSSLAARCSPTGLLETGCRCRLQIQLPNTLWGQRAGDVVDGSPAAVLRLVRGPRLGPALAIAREQDSSVSTVGRYGAAPSAAWTRRGAWREPAARASTGHGFDPRRIVFSALTDLGLGGSGNTHTTYHHLCFLRATPSCCRLALALGRSAGAAAMCSSASTS